MLLLHLEGAGVLEDLTLEDIGNITGVNRSTIHRDLKELEGVKKEYCRLMTAQPWVKRELTPEEFAERIGVTGETVRCMLRDGLVYAVKRPEDSPSGRWYIPATELDWWLRSRD